MEMKRYDRSTEDVGNLVLLEHVNVTQPDQRLATLFYVAGLGGTRDPFIMVSTDNMWVNFGRHQVHLPTREPQRVRGTVGFVVPDLKALKANLERVAPELAGTRFAWRERDGAIEATCPWGNRVRCHAPAAQFGDTELGIPYVDLDVPPGTSAGIARFYEEIMEVPAKAAKGIARVSVGRSQELRFTETREPLPAYDGHHVAVYMADFSAPYQRLLERGLVSMETDAHEWRFKSIVDPKTNAELFELEHEVRSLRHPLYARPLVNRNPTQTNRSYVRGQDAFRGTY